MLFNCNINQWQRILQQDMLVKHVSENHISARGQSEEKQLHWNPAFPFPKANRSSLCQLSSIAKQCFIGRLLWNRVHSNSNKAETIIWVDTVLTFVIMEYVRTINSPVGSLEISQAISLIRKSNLVSKNKGNLGIYLAFIWLGALVLSV